MRRTRAAAQQPAAFIADWMVEICAWFADWMYSACAFILPHLPVSAMGQACTGHGAHMSSYGSSSPPAAHADACSCVAPICCSSCAADGQGCGQRGGSAF